MLGAVLVTFTSPFTVAAAPTNIQETKNAFPLTATDFTVVISDHSLALGDVWNDKTMQFSGKEISSQFVGEVPFGDSSYKFWQHNYAGYSVYSSNFLWDKQNRSVDSYIFTQISLDSSEIVTSRGVKTGDSINKLLASYGPGTLDDSDDERWLSYDTFDKRISFQIEDNKVSHIIMVFRMDN